MFCVASPDFCTMSNGQILLHVRDQKTSQKTGDFTYSVPDKLLPIFQHWLAVVRPGMFLICSLSLCLLLLQIKAAAIDSDQGLQGKNRPSEVNLMCPFAYQFATDYLVDKKLLKKGNLPEVLQGCKMVQLFQSHLLDCMVSMLWEGSRLYRYFHKQYKYVCNQKHYKNVQHIFSSGLKHNMDVTHERVFMHPTTLKPFTGKTFSLYVKSSFEDTTTFAVGPQKMRRIYAQGTVNCYLGSSKMVHSCMLDSLLRNCNPDCELLK